MTHRWQHNTVLVVRVRTSDVKSQQQVAPVVSQRLERSENELRAVFVHADVERESSDDLETDTFMICKSGQAGWLHK